MNKLPSSKWNSTKKFHYLTLCRGWDSQTNDILYTSNRKSIYLLVNKFVSLPWLLLLWPGWPEAQGSIKTIIWSQRGGKLIHILTFWGRLIKFFPLTRVKVEILLSKYSIFRHILNSFDYFVCLCLLFCTFYLWI